MSDMRTETQPTLNARACSPRARLSSSVPRVFTRWMRSRETKMGTVMIVGVSLSLADLGTGAALSAQTLLPASTSSETPFLDENEAAMRKMMTGMSIEPSGNVDQDFAAMMIPHHQGAIEMAQAELRHGRNELLRRIAQEIVVEQQQEIAAMRIAIGEKVSPNDARLAAAGPRLTAQTSLSLPPQFETSATSLMAEAPFLAKNNAAMSRMMDDMSLQPTGNIDRDFVQMMAPHHQGGIDMALTELRYGRDARLRGIAQEIIVDQMQEIALMRVAIGEAPPPVASPTDSSPDNLYPSRGAR